jgi:hypothetical protein
LAARSSPVTNFPLISANLSPGIVRGFFVPAVVKLKIARMSQMGPN